MTLEERRVIKFNHDYCKLPLHWKDTKATLFHFWITNSKILERDYPNLVFYDTRFRDEEGCYSLGESQEVVVLFLVHVQTGKPFLTIRSYDWDKVNDYRAGLRQDWLLIDSRDD